MKISFILTILNRPDKLAKFFQMPIQTLPHEWVLVDNGSDLRTIEIERWLAKYDKNLHVIENGQNLGFGPGNNIGEEYSTGDILVFTQPDVEFRGDVTTYLQGLQPRKLYGHQYLSYDTGWNKFGNEVIPYLTGYFLACTRGTWVELGGFDPIYWPADFEDVDLSMTAVKKGIELIQIDVPVSHASFGSTWAQFPDRESVTRKNRQLFAAKWGLPIDTSTGVVAAR